jgi:hypothetical protein
MAAALPDDVDHRLRRAQMVSALYVALLLCTPWIVRESTLLLPPSASASAEASSEAACAAIDAVGTTLGVARLTRFCT